VKHIQAVLLTFAATGLCVAQGQYGRGAGTAPGSSLDIAKVQTVTGTVSAVAIGYGMQYPSITIGKIQIKLAPIWYLLDKNFEINIGDALSVQVAPFISTSNPYLYALEITNTMSNQRLVLRDALGKPLWASPQSPFGAHSDGGCPLRSLAVVVSGTVEQIISGIAIQMPMLTLRVADGTVLRLKLGPERVLLESDIELKPGEPATVKYVSYACSDELVALTVTNAAGKTVVLREENGRPGWR
jgi:hypothetical protein